jgi:hypothetical protein
LANLEHLMCHHYAICEVPKYEPVILFADILALSYRNESYHKYRTCALTVNNAIRGYCEKIGHGAIWQSKYRRILILMMKV